MTLMEEIKKQLARVNELEQRSSDLYSALDWSQFEDVCALPTGEQTNADAVIDAWEYNGKPRRGIDYCIPK